MKAVTTIIVFFLIASFIISANSTDDTERIYSGKVEKLCIDTIISKSEYKALFFEIDSLQSEITRLKQLNNELSEESKNANIYTFLNLSDTTIFGSGFLKLPIKILHIRDREYYNLINNIRELCSTLDSIEKMNISQFEDIKNRLNYAHNLIDIVNSFADTDKRKITDYLSEDQKSFYRSQVARYNKLYDLINTTQTNQNASAVVNHD